MLVVRATGEASWVLRLSHAGKRLDLTLGRWPAVTLRLARELADQARNRAATGLTPSIRRQSASTAKPIDTVLRLYQDWMKKKEAGEVAKGNIEAAMKKNVLPAIGHFAPQDVTRVDVMNIIRAIEARGSTDMCRRVRMWIRQMYEFGVDDELRPLLTNSPVPIGPLVSVQSHKKGNFKAITNVAEVAELMRKIRGAANYPIRVALCLSAYTFQRPAEIREAIWDEFDLNAAKWTIPASRLKMNKEHWVPLATQVVDMLQHYQRGYTGDVGYLFPGRGLGKPLSEGTLTPHLNNMGFKNRHSPHGFRAMARTLIREQLKVDGEVIEKQLSHEIDNRLHGAYNRAEYWDERVAMMQAWANWLDTQT